MLTRIANLGLRAPRRLLILAGLLILAAAVFGAPVSSHLSAGGFADPAAPSTRANDLLASRFHAGDPNLILQISGPAQRTEGIRLATELRKQRYASQVTSYWTAPADLKPGLHNKDSGLVVARIAGDDDSAPKRAAAITDRLLAHHPEHATVRAGGIATAYHQVSEQVSRDLALAEAVAVPLTGLALIWVFGSLIAALLPLAVGVVSIVGTLAILRGLALLTDVSIYAMNLTTALGLALAIDYSLFVVSRYREETRTGRAPHDAVRVTMRTAGRTVLFSACTVALSLAALLVFPVYFLRSFAYAGIAVVALAAAAALLVLPALLALLGPRVDALDLRIPVRRWLHRPPPRQVAAQDTFWGRTAAAVMRHAVPVGLAVTALFLLLGSPFLGVRFGYPDDRVLPSSASAHQVGDALRGDFSSDAAATITVVAPKSTGASPARYSAALSRIGGVTAVSSSTGTYAAGRLVAKPSGPRMTVAGSSYLVVRTSPDPMSAAGKRLLAQLQATRAPWPLLITGAGAENADSLQSLRAKLPLALGLIAVATFCVLFLFTGSVVLPIKALILNTLSLTATFGAMVWIFQNGHLPGLFSATVTGYLVPTMPILMFCLSFGISMDYEVFLLSRIREEWLASDRSAAANVRAVTLGLGRTGRLVTAAALLMAIVFAGLATGGVSFMQLFGAGLTLAVLMDATLVRGVLVPVFMRLAGRANWWAPAPLAHWHERHGWSESAAGVSAATPDRDVVKTG